MVDIVGTISGNGYMVGHLGAVYGKDGKSAYEIAVKNGFGGTEEEWLTSLVGEKGEQGTQGPQGEKGDAGAIKFVVVSELPASGSEDSIYLVPNATGEDNKFDEYIYQNGAWEKIGSAGVEVNLDEYVKKTDYATYNNYGLVKAVSTYNGIAVDKGQIGVSEAGKTDIDSRVSARVISPRNLDYAVKVGLTTNKEEWTEEEKASARELVGAVGTTDYATKDIGGVVKSDDRYGTRMINGVLDICAANNSVIDNRTINQNSLYSAGSNSRHPIVPSNVDYAVKKVLSDCKVEWTDEEKAAARTLLGVNIEDALDAIIAIQESLIGGNA